MLPFKREVYSVVRAIGTPPKRVCQHLHFEGDFRVPVAPGRSFLMRSYGYEIENEVFWAGLEEGWESVSMKIWMKLCRQAQVILDVGANTGLYSLVAQSLNPSSDVYAFEPVHRVYEKLLHNIQINQFPIQAFPQAVSNADGDALIYDTSTEHIYSVTVNQNLNSPDTPVVPTTIETLSLSSFIERQKLEQVDLMKIDVETHEAKVLEGMGEYLQKFSPTMLVEILNEEVAANVQNLIEGMNYDFYNIDERGGVRKVDKLGRSDYYNFLLCKPELADRLDLL